MKPNEIEQKLKDIFGAFITITNPKEIKPGESWEIPEEELREITSTAQEITRIRGSILTRAVEIDSIVGRIIKYSIFGKDTENSDLFENLILKTNFFSTMNKLNVFRELVKQHNMLKNNDYSSLLTEIQEFMNTRNKFAHGTVVFKGKEPFLCYYQRGDREDELTCEYFEKISKSFKQIYCELLKIQCLLKS